MKNIDNGVCFVYTQCVPIVSMKKLFITLRINFIGEEKDNVLSKNASNITLKLP